LGTVKFKSKVLPFTAWNQAVAEFLVLAKQIGI